MSSSISGLGSSQITSELDDYEEQLEEPITALDAQITTDKAEISAWGTIQGSISTLSTALSGIEDLSTINTRTASVGAGGAFTATASAAAQTGTYNVNVKALASVQEIYSTASSSSASAKIGSAKGGSLTFSLDGGKTTETVQVGSGSMTLNGIASAINKMAGGVKAGVVSTANGAELTLQSSATGASQAFTVTASTSSLAKFDYTGSSTTEPSSSVMKLAQSAANSSLTVNGVPITATSNKIAGAMTGVSLTLTGIGSSTLTVGSSTAGISSAVGKVATDLNAAISTIAQETYWAGSSTTISSASASSSSAEKSGGLAGNATAESISNQLLAAVSGAVASGMTSEAIGLSVSSTGAVALDTTTFASAYAQNPTAVQNLLTQIYTGLSTATKAALGSSTSTGSTGNTVGEGTITAQTEAEQNTVTSINSEISQMEKTDVTDLDNMAAAYSAAESAATNDSITSMYLDIFTDPSSS